MKLGLSIFPDLCVFQWLRIANAFDERSIYYPRHVRDHATYLFLKKHPNQLTVDKVTLYNGTY